MSKSLSKLSRFVRALVLLSFCGHAIAADTVYIFKSYTPGIKGDYALVAGPAAISFDAVIAGQSSGPQSVTFHNIGTSPVSVSSVIAGAEFTQTNTCTFLPANATCGATVSFAPTQTGALTGNLTLVYDNGRVLAVPLSGTGVGATPIATFSTNTVAFGAVPIGSVATRGVQLDNTGQQLLVVSGVTTAGAAFGATHGCGTLEPTATCVANVAFTPVAVDVVNGTLEFTTNAPGSPHGISLSGSGAAPVVGFAPVAPLVFGNTTVGVTSAAQTVTVSNASSSATLGISSIAADAPFSAVATTCPTVLAPAASCTVDVAYAPTATGPGQTGSLRVTGDLSGSGLTYQLTDGQAAYALTGTAVAAVPVISLTALPATGDFGPIALGASSSKLIMLTNTGYGALRLTSTALSGANSADFSKSASTCESVTLAHNATCTITVAVSPAVPAAEVATLTFANSDGATSNTVSLTATGQGAVIALTDAGASNITDVGFPSTSTGTASAVVPVTLTNIGNLPLTLSGTGIVTVAPFSQSNTCGTSVAAGASCLVNLVFSPATVQDYSGALTITSNAYGYTPLTLFGTGSLVGVAQVSGGNTHTLILKTDGTVWASGSLTGNYGQLGDNVLTGRSVALQVLTGVSRISAGANHSLALKTDGTLWTTGYNASGQLGDGTVTSRKVFAQVALPGGAGAIADIAGGIKHTLILKTDGTLWAAGDGSLGTFGNGTTTGSRTFVQIATGVSAMSPGYYATFIVKTDNTLWATGGNYDGGLGDGTVTNRLNFVQVLTGVSRVSAGASHTLALKTDNTVWATGGLHDNHGQLGDGVTTGRTTFVQVLTGVSRIVTGGYASAALKTDGTLWGAGANYSGQLGDGTSNNMRTSFIQTLTGVSDLSFGSGGASLFAVRPNQTLWATGSSTNGEFGNGAGGSRSTFTQILP